MTAKVRPSQASTVSDGGRLAGAVGADQRDHAAAGDEPLARSGRAGRSARRSPRRGARTSARRRPRAGGGRTARSPRSSRCPARMPRAGGRRRAAAPPGSCGRPVRRRPAASAARCAATRAGSARSSSHSSSVRADAGIGPLSATTRVPGQVLEHQPRDEQDQLELRRRDAQVAGGLGGGDEGALERQPVVLREVVPDDQLVVRVDVDEPAGGLVVAVVVEDARQRVRTARSASLKPSPCSTAAKRLRRPRARPAGRGRSPRCASGRGTRCS